ncbi:hypothetical protein QL285_045090 [Trifolium repens]|nr:hypothetical protein QL285_045090 [Trifolium repens]
MDEVLENYYNKHQHLHNPRRWAKCLKTTAIRINTRIIRKDSLVPGIIFHFCPGEPGDPDPSSSSTRVSLGGFHLRGFRRLRRRLHSDLGTFFLAGRRCINIELLKNVGLQELNIIFINIVRT